MASDISNGQGGDNAGGAGRSRREIIRAATRRPSKAPRPIGRSAPAPQSREAQRIFVSYSHQDLHIVRPLVERLRDAGASVTWDRDFIGGIDFEQAICSAIDGALCVIVVWSAESVQSPFVRDEARRALVTNKLVTTHVADFKPAGVPLGFGHLHTVPVDDHDLVRKSLSERGVIFRA
jgi:hypothetical protein